MFNQNPTSEAPKEMDQFLPLETICGFKVAYIIFEDPSAVDELISLNTDDLCPLELKEDRSMGLISKC